MINFILTTILGFLIIGVVWTLVSVIFYLISVVFRSKKPIGLIVGVSYIFNFLYQMLLFIWFIYVAYTLFANGAILFGLLFVFLLGGLITGFYATIAGLISLIPLYFYAKLEDRFSDELIGEDKSEVIEGTIVKNKKKKSSEDDELEDWETIKNRGR